MYIPKLRNSPILIISGQTHWVPVKDILTGRDTNLRVQWVHTWAYKHCLIYKVACFLVIPELKDNEWDVGERFQLPCLPVRKAVQTWIPTSKHASLFTEQWDSELEKIQMLLLQEKNRGLWCIMARLTSTMGSRLLTFDVGQTPYGEGDNHFTSGFSRNLVGNRISVPWGRYLETKIP